MLRHLAAAAALLLFACNSTPPPVVDMNLGCQSNGDCATSATGHVCASATHACVVCAADADCGQGRKCANQKACVDCVGAGDCTPGNKCVGSSCVAGCDDKNPCPTGKVCDPTAGACVECAADADCAASTAAPKCDVATHKCVGCNSDDDCGAGKVCHAQACAAGCSGSHPQCPTGQVCNLAAGGVCVACLGDTDCKTAGAPRCDTTASTCVACLPSNDNCASGTFCAGTSCVAGCKADADCANGGSSGADGGVTGGTQCSPQTHQCVECVNDAACAAGQVCASNHCVAGCTAQHACPGGQGCCGGACVNVLSDTANCGACGNACPAGQGCCGGQCVSFSTTTNCGACGNACADVANGTRACSASTCGIGACNGTYADCDKSATDGCEVDTATSPSNCGACGKTCSALPNAAPGCSGGACALGVCHTGFADCDLQPQNGCETDLTKDNANCGVCRNVCPPVANGTGGCTAGKCTIGSCNTGFADCDKNPTTGCEVNLTNDAKNCGGCGTVCSGQTPLCYQSKCVPNSGFNVVTTKDITYNGINYLLVKVTIRSNQSTSADWCQDYTNLCQSFGYLPTGCGQQFTSGNNGYGYCRTQYLSDGVSDSLGCNPSGGISNAAQQNGFSDATGYNSFGFHYCTSGGTCTKTLCSGQYCSTGISYIDMTQPFGYTLCKK